MENNVMHHGDAIHHRNGLTLTGKLFWSVICTLYILLILDFTVEQMTGQCSRFWNFGGGQDIYFREGR